MRNEPAWVSPEHVIEVNRGIVVATGEAHALLNRGLLESAVDRARNLYAYDESVDIADMAAALLLGVARNHAFEQGNKRTGFVASQLFLDFNGYLLDVPDTPSFANLIIRTMADTALDRAFISVLRQYCVPR